MTLLQLSPVESNEKPHINDLLSMSKELLSKNKYRQHLGQMTLMCHRE